MPPSSPSLPPDRASLKVRRHAVRFAVELVVVFVGVYGAFLLNTWREDRRHARQRAQVYSILLEELQDVQRNTNAFVRAMGPRFARFDSLYQAGAMPQPFPITFSVRFTPHMWNATLETAGLDVLDAETIYEISAVYNELELAFAALDQLVYSSREVLIPNLEEGRAEFYDTTTATLHPKYQWFYQHTRELNLISQRLAKRSDAVIAKLESDLAD